jgi:two-component system OmpR family sensor kinase
MRWSIALAGGVVAAVLLLAGWWVLRLGLRPIADLTEVADAIATGERDRRATVGQPGTEAAHLARAFNLMLDERAATEDRLRQFVGDASHELRTPVTVIRGFTDLYRQGGLDEAGTEDAMRRIGQESARMAGLVDDLLLLARLDQGRPLERAQVDLSAVIHDTALDATATHPSREVLVDTSDRLVVMGDDARLRQVIGNLVGNAFAHGGPDATVTLRGHGDDGIAVVEVSDNGVGMDEHTAQHAFDRFFRADGARTRHRGGAGLGLPIAKAIVEAHGGALELTSAPGRGTTVRMVLPNRQETRNSA